MSVNVKLWWDNRHKLNTKMLTSLLAELRNMRIKAEAEMLLDKPAFGIEQEERDRRNAAFFTDLDQKISECESLLAQK